jgi:ABC-type glycerol-3-phosphate transport system permease component
VSLIIVKEYYKMPTAALIACFRHEYADEVGALLAASTLQTIPMVALFIIFGKNFVSGITMRLK